MTPFFHFSSHSKSHGIIQKGKNHTIEDKASELGMAHGRVLQKACLGLLIATPFLIAYKVLTRNSTKNDSTYMYAPTLSSTILMEHQLGPKVGSVSPEELGSTEFSPKKALRHSKKNSLALVTWFAVIALVILVVGVAYYVYRKKQSARGNTTTDSVSGSGKTGGGKRSTSASASTV